MAARVRRAWLARDVVGGLAAGAVVIPQAMAYATVGRAVRRTFEPAIDNDQELLVSGLSCAAGAFFRAMPAAGGFSQTAINQRAGARTQLSELVTVALAIACALFLGLVLSDLPGDLGLHGPHRRARPDRPGRLRAVLAAQPPRALGRRRHRRQRPGARAAAQSGDQDLRAAGAHTEPVPGLLVLRFDGPLYTANVRSATRKILASVDQHPATDVLVLDAAALAQLSITVIEEFAELERELGDGGVTLWIAALPPKALHTARQTPRWRELDQADRLCPTAGAAVRAFQAR